VVEGALEVLEALEQEAVQGVGKWQWILLFGQKMMVLMATYCRLSRTCKKYRTRPPCRT
jgi:hypothetical protein